MDQACTRVYTGDKYINEWMKNTQLNECSRNKKPEFCFLTQTDSSVLRLPRKQAFPVEWIGRVGVQSAGVCGLVRAEAGDGHIEYLTWVSIAGIPLVPCGR